MTEQRNVIGSAQSQASKHKQTGKEVPATGDTVAMSSPTSKTVVAPFRSQPKLSYESKGNAFQQKGPLPIPASDPDYAKRTFALGVVGIVMSVLIMLSLALWMRMTGSVVIACAIALCVWLTYFCMIPRIASVVDNWFNRNRPYCVLVSREEVMYSTSGFASIVGIAITLVLFM